MAHVMSSALPCGVIALAPARTQRPGVPSSAPASSSSASLTVRAGADGPSAARRPAAPVAPAPPPAPPSPSSTAVDSPPAATATATPTATVSLEYQRQVAKELVSYFQEKKLEDLSQSGQVFGWTRKNEIGNGRWVMFGLAVGLLTEYATGVNFPSQIAIVLENLGIID